MNVLLNRVGQLEVDHRLDTDNVQSSGGDIRGQENVDLFILELFQRLQTLGLRHVSVKLGSSEPQQAEHDVQTLALLFGPDKNYNVIGECPRQEGDEDSLLFVLVSWTHSDKLLLQIPSDSFVAVHKNLDRRLERHQGQLVDLVRHGGGEQHGLAGR